MPAFAGCFVMKKQDCFQFSRETLTQSDLPTEPNHFGFVKNNLYNFSVRKKLIILEILRIFDRLF